jgi:arthrofactin-type cyclic lipopeptide synthetase C
MLSQDALASYLERVRSTATIGRRPADAVVPLSFGQEQVWLHGLLAPTLPLYNETVTIRYAEALNVDALENSLNEVVRRHEAWRTTIEVVDGEPFQKVHAAQPIPFHHIDLTPLQAASREEEARSLATESAVRLFDLERGPLLRALVITLAENDHRLFLILHHLIFDGASIRAVFLPELLRLYAGFSQGRQPYLPELSFQYGDYAYWQRQKRAANMEASAAYWRSQLASPPVLALPSDRPRPAMLTFRGASRTFQFSESVTTALRECAAREDVTLFNLLFATFALLLGRLSNQKDVAIGVPVAANTDPQLEALLGYFLNTVVFRTDLSGNPQFRELLSRVHEVTIAALSHAEVPLQDIVQDLHPSREGAAPIFQTLFSMAPPLAELPPQWSMSEVEVCTGTAKEDLEVQLDDRGDRIIGRIFYKTDLFDASTIDRLVGHWTILLTSAVEDPRCHISDLPLMSEAEHRWLISEVNDTTAEFPSDKCVHQLFEHQVAGTPGAVAVLFDEDSLSYYELNRRANQLAHYLRKLGVKPDARVAICVERGFEMVVALLAVVKAGGAYVPLDPAYPVERLRFMLEDCSPVALLTQRHLKGIFAGLRDDLPLLDLAAASAAWCNLPETNPDPGAIGLTAESLAYVIYTSGSTGVPKGVMIEHRSLVNRIVWMQRAYELISDDAVLQKTPFSFDVSVWEFFWPLLTGARLVMARPEGHRDPLYLCEAIRRYGITTLHFVPSMLQAFLTHADQVVHSKLRRVVCSGEALPASLVRRFQECLPKVALYNLYGPTEATVDVTAWSCPPAARQTNPPIGQPIANTRIYILNDDGEPVPIGVVGELYIAGVQVARGYLNRAKLTAERFLLDPFNTEPERRMYRTGDLARWLADGNIEYLGRNDFQVKIRGFRIELGEIETRLAAHPGVSEAAVVAREDSPGDKRLVAYYTEAAPGTNQVEADALRHHLAAELPEHMVPSAFVRLDSLPVTVNGKLDRDALPAPGSNAFGSRSFEPPVGDTEIALAEIWAELLKLDRIGRHDNFFEIGGHSLLAMRMVARTSASFRKRLTLTLFIQTPTIAHLAQLLSGKEVSQVAVVNKGSAKKIPLILVAPQPWHPRLTAHLSPEQPVISFALTQAEIASTGPKYRLEDLAACMVRKIRRSYPLSAYALAGFCQPSLLAYECAQQLRRLGYEIPLLVIGDVLPPGYLQSLSFAERSKRRLEREAFYLSAIRNSRPSDWKNLLERRIGGFRAMREQRRWEKFYRSGANDPQAIQEMYEVLLVARMSYAASPYSGRVLYLQSGNRPQTSRWDPASTWEGLLDEPEIFESSGDHTSIFEEPHIIDVARRLQLALDNAANEMIRAKALA